MKEKGSIAGFLISKLSLGLAVTLLIGSVLAMQGGLNSKNRRQKLELIAKKVGRGLRKIDSLPGKVRIERNLPSLSGDQEIVISGTNKDTQSVKIEVIGEEKIRNIVFLSRKVNGGKFRISKKNPRKINIRKSNQISIEVI